MVVFIYIYIYSLFMGDEEWMGSLQHIIIICEEIRHYIPLLDLFQKSMVSIYLCFGMNNLVFGHSLLLENFSEWIYIFFNWYRIQTHISTKLIVTNRAIGWYPFQIRCLGEAIVTLALHFGYIPQQWTYLKHREPYQKPKHV